jgi:hypothetical protein
MTSGRLGCHPSTPKDTIWARMGHPDVGGIAMARTSAHLPAFPLDVLITKQLPCTSMLGSAFGYHEEMPRKRRPIGTL